MPAESVIGNYTPDPSQLTHGTAMMDTIAQALAANTGGSTSVKILPMDVYGANEQTSTFNVAQGIAKAYNDGATVMNTSLGSTGDSSVLRNIIQQLIQRGVVFYAAAGNSPVTSATYPAAYPGVVAVTASGDNGQIASYANHGSFVQMMAPGDNVVGFNGQNYLVEGTSTATAFATGMAAGIADAHHACADQAQSLLKQSLGSTSIPTESVDQ
jgi:thermitase